MKNELTVTEVAELCSWPESTVLDWIKRERLPAYSSPDEGLIIHRRELIRFLQKRRYPVPDELIQAHENFTVLIVDDEAALRRMLRRHLVGQFPGITVEESGEGMHAGWLAHALRPDIVMLDLLLPGMDGFRLCQMIRSRANMKDVRIIAMTALSEEESRSRIMAVGADDFIPKPFDAESLKRIITKQLSKEKAA